MSFSFTTKLDTLGDCMSSDCCILVSGGLVALVERKELNICTNLCVAMKQDRLLMRTD
jgi:hypothetical protein